MIRIVSIAVSGECEAGRFSGRLAFDQGLQVVTAPNRFGKSLVFASITWCLGVEQIYGVKAGDTGIFPDAVRRGLKAAGNRDVPVTSSEASLLLERDDGRRLQLTRSILGGDPNRIHYAEESVSGDLRVGYGASSDGTSGFQAKFREWAGLPEHHLVRAQGGEFPIYLENLAPLFLIEQLRGWTSVQAEQVYRYGLQDIADAAFEYLLGLDSRLRARLQAQRARLQSGSLREEARFLADQFKTLMTEQGWVGSLPSVGSDLKEGARRWSEQRLSSFVEERFSYRFEKENEALQSKLAALKAELATPSSAAPARVSVQAAQRLIELKTHRDKIQQHTGDLRAQLDEHTRILHAVEERLASAKDLRRLKESGLGILPVAECPTCQQSIDPGALQLDQQSTASINEHVASLERQRKVLNQGIERIRAELVKSATEDRTISGEIAAAQRALGLTQQAVGSEREKAIQLATEIMEVEREADRNRRLQLQLLELQKAIDSWTERAGLVLGGEEAEAEGAAPLIAKFEHHVRKNAAALGVGGLDASEIGDVRVGPHYEVMLKERSLPAYGSASDRARLVMTYVLALLAAGTQHIGFVVLDEPIQQNPDEAHRTKWIQNLGSLTALEGRQTIIFTSLRPDEQEALAQKGVPLMALEGKLLNIGPPPPVSAPSTEDGSPQSSGGP